MTGNNWVNINCGGPDINDYGSGIHQFRALRVISHATSKVVFTCTFIPFRTRTTAWHAYHSSTHLPQLHLQNTTAQATIPPLFSSPFVIRPSHSTHLTCYHPCCGKLFAAILIDIILITSYSTTSHCHLESYANNLTKHVILLAASFSRLKLWPASSSPPSSSTSYSSRRIVQLPTVTGRAVLII